MGIKKKKTRLKSKEKRATEHNALKKNKISVESPKSKTLRGLGSINPKPVDAEIEDRIETYANEYYEYLNTPNSRIIPSFGVTTYDLKASCEEALHDLLNLEINGDYLTEERLSSWKSVISNAKLFYRLLIYISISYNLPKTKGISQAQYFSEIFGIEDYNVSKTLKNTKILVFLYLGASNINEIKDLNLLMSIGNENDFICSKLIDVQRQYGDSFLLKVFKECQKKTETDSKVKKITGSLVQAVAESYAKQLDLVEMTNKGAIDDYTTVELSSLMHINTEKDNSNTDSANTKSEIGITELISNIREQKNTLSELTTNKDKYGSNEIEDLLHAIEELQDLADSLS
jgi:hypothetical protein